jgi:hypothetical protein
MGKNLYNGISLVMVLSLLFAFGCQESIIVGSDLLDDEKLNLAFNDTLSLSSKTIVGERVATYRPNINSKTYTLGQLNDNLFGKLTSELILTNQMSGTTKANYHLITESVRFDSLVLVLKYDTLGTYGAYNSVHHIKVHQLKNTYLANDTIYSDRLFEFEPMPLYDGFKEIDVNDTIVLKDHLTQTFIKQAPQLRLRLNDNFGKLIFNDSMAAQSDTSFTNLFKGLIIKSIPVSGSSIYGFDFTSENLNTGNAQNKLIMYYTVGDTMRKEYQYFITTATANKITHDITGSQVDDFIKNPIKGDSITFIQGMGGSKTVISFDDLTFLEDKFINKVEMDIFVSEIGVLNSLYRAPIQLLASRKNAAGSLELIPDLAQLVNNGIPFGSIFGGVLNSDNLVKKYTINITNHIKRALRDKTYNSDLYIGILNEAETPRRAVFYGAKHSTYPMKLRVTYTKI